MDDYNISRTLGQSANQYPDRIGLTSKIGNRYQHHTFQQLERMVNALCHGLHTQGVERNMRVMLMTRPSLEFVCLAFALFRMGAVVILIDPGMGYKNLRRCIGSVKPEILLGTPKALLFRNLSPGPFQTVRRTILIHPRIGFFPATTSKQAFEHPFSVVPSGPTDQAAIIFTTGSTGPPKGVCYEHGVFHAQLRFIRDYYKIGPEDIDQPAFPLFALFSTGLGARAVIPDMDPTRPARVNPEKFIRSINEFGVTYSFGSPAIWNVVSRYCLNHKIKLPTLKKVLMAGAPIPGDLIGRVRDILPTDAEIHTPYGATECLPLTSITGSEIWTDTWSQTQTGRGTCVGQPLPGNKVRIIPASDKPIAEFKTDHTLATGEIGEIIAQGPVATRQYDNNAHENRLAKIKDHPDFWHRMGDMGYLDDTGRLWVCGRKAHRVMTANGPLFTLCCEAIFNRHPAVFRSALVGLGEPPAQLPVIIVELADPNVDHPALLRELEKMAAANPLTSGIVHFLIHPAFPTDIRHNAKIFREKLSVWAARKI